MSKIHVKTSQGRLVVWFDASIRHVPSVFPLAKPQMPKIGGHHSANVAVVQLPWAVLEEACLLQ